jgi:hypothetical protein
MRRFLAIATLALLAGHWPAGVRGDLIIDVGNTNIAVGGTGVIDVTITDTSSLGDNLALTGFQFQITPTDGTTSALAFSTSQANSGLTSSNYLFFGDSGDVEGGQPLGVATTPTTYTGGDNTADFTNVTVTSSTTFLLAQLDLSTLTGSCRRGPGIHSRSAWSAIRISHSSTTINSTRRASRPVPGR